MSNTNIITGDDDVADEAEDKRPPRRGEGHQQKDDSKEETGRDTPRPYATIVGGEGQDFVATTLSTAAQVNNGTNDWGFHHPSISFGASSFGRALFTCFSLFFLLSLSGEPLTNAFFLCVSLSLSVCLDANRSKRPCKKCNPRAR